ncbi:FtsB family cell division protein [Streptomyces roseoverticillatus]|uniref:Septum formation initiator family protein n=1 Tax=Streptomyces roseoverticillatus TaxID=66429 RepID=A0ABV3IUQ7_9ACTN
MTPAARRGTRLGRLVGPVGAKRTPFVLLVVVLLGSGLISLLLLNSALNQGSFELSRLQRKTTELTDEQQALQQEVDQLAAPDALERRARELGMVPGGNPAFLGPDGTVRGQPSPAGDGTVAYRAPAPADPGPRPALLPAPRPVHGPELPAVPVPPAAGAPARVPPPAPAPALVPAPTAVPTTPTSGR